MNADEMAFHSSRMVQLLKMIFGLMEFICKNALNTLLQIIWSITLIIFSNLRIRSGGIYEGKSFIIWIWKCSAKYLRCK